MAPNTTPAPAASTALSRGVDPRTFITFATKHPNRTAWIEIEYPVDTVPQGLLDDLAAVGFAQNTRFVTLGPAEAYDRATGQNLGYISQEVTLAAPPGTGLFGSWTDDEGRTHMAAARRVFRKHGVTRVPVWRKTLHDLI